LLAFLVLDLCVICWLLYSRSQEPVPRGFDWKGLLAVCLGFWCALAIFTNFVPSFSAMVGLSLILAALFTVEIIGRSGLSPPVAVVVAAGCVVLLGLLVWRAPAKGRLAVTALVLCAAIVLTASNVGASIRTHLAFLGPPLIGAAGIAVVCAGAVGLIVRRVPLVIPVAVFLCVFGGVFLVWAESRRSHLMEAAIAAIAPDCSRQSSFLSSLRAAGDWPQLFVHAIVKKGSSTLIWSYREMKFVDLPESARANIAGC